MELKKVKSVKDLKMSGMNMSEKIVTSENESVFVTMANEGVYSMHMAVKTDDGENSKVASKFNEEYSMCDEKGANEAIDRLRKYFLFSNPEADVKPEKNKSETVFVGKEGSLSKIYSVGDLSIGDTTEFNFGIIRVAVEFEAADKFLMYAPEDELDVNTLGDEIMNFISENFDTDLNLNKFTKKFNEFQYMIRRRLVAIEQPEEAELKPEPKKLAPKKEEPKKKAAEKPKPKEMKKSKQESITSQAETFDIGQAFIEMVDKATKSEAAKPDYKNDPEFTEAVKAIVKQTLADAFGK